MAMDAADVDLDKAVAAERASLVAERERTVKAQIEQQEAHLAKKQAASTSATIQPPETPESGGPVESDGTDFDELD